MTAAILPLIAVCAQAPAVLTGADFPPYDAAVSAIEDRGLTAKAAARARLEAPDRPETVRLLVKARRIVLALDVLRGIVESHPERMAEGFEAIAESSELRDGARDYQARLQEIIALGRQQLPRLSREQAAWAARRMMWVDVVPPAQLTTHTHEDRVNAFLQEYDGTEAAWFFRIERTIDRPYPERVELADAIAREHPGTTIAARALYEKSFHLSTNLPSTGPQRISDPTENLFKVIDIVRELESGRYPRSEWTERAPSLVQQMYVYKPVYAPGNVDRVLDAYYTHLKTHFRMDQRYGLNGGAGYFISYRLAELFALKGDPDGVERTLIRLEDDVADAGAVRYLRALYYLRGPSEPTNRPAPPPRRALDVLESLAAGDSAYRGKALATLATVHLRSHDYAKARTAFHEFVQRYPESEYAWVAALREGECDEALGEWEAAAGAFRSAAETFGSNSLALVLARAFAGRAEEALGRFDAALKEQAAALAAWDVDYGFDYELRSLDAAPSPGAARIDGRVSKSELAARVARLKAALAAAGGSDVERGRWLLEHDRREEAVAAFEQVLTRHPRSPAAAEARLLLHRAKLETALQLGDVERPDTNEAAAAAALDALAREPADPVIAIAKMARASIFWKHGDTTPAETLMTEALDVWIKTQIVRTPASPLEEDVAAIREAVFRPLGGGIYASSPLGWNAFSWPAALPHALIVGREVTVDLPDGDRTTVSTVRPIVGLPNVVFLDREQETLLNRTILALGGTKRREWTQVMQTPNQPVGDSMTILSLWNAYFPARPGHWGGWVFTTYPILTSVTFLDPARTRAAAAVTIGYSGATVVLEKRDGTWTAISVTNHWIT